MDNRDINIVHDTIFSLKEAKRKSFMQVKKVDNLQSTLEDCRMIDMMLMPLYYVWEHVMSQDLSVVGMEQHLAVPYQRFSRSPITTTWELYLLIAIGMKMPKSLHKKNIVNSILSVYEILITKTHECKIERV